MADQTRTTITDSTTVTVRNDVGQRLGTNAFVTFTPTYTCWPVAINCGTPEEGQVEYCQPALDPDGKTLEGDYLVVYIS